VQNGLGKMLFKDGSVKEGLFENNIYKGVLSSEEIEQYTLKMMEEERNLKNPTPLRKTRVQAPVVGGGSRGRSLGMIDERRIEEVVEEESGGSSGEEDSTPHTMDS
jgi:hypothetical protein